MAQKVRAEQRSPGWGSEEGGEEGGEGVALSDLIEISLSFVFLCCLSFFP